MVYTPEELELITIATELAGEQGLEEQTKAFLDEFPESLKTAREYFLNYIEYRRIISEDHSLKVEIIVKSREIEARKKNGKSLDSLETELAQLKAKSAKIEKYSPEKLAALQERIENNFKQAESDQEIDLMQYLKSHFKLRCSFDKENNLSLKENRPKQEEGDPIEREMQELADNGFSPVQILRAELPDCIEEEQLEAYKAGHRQGDLACKIRLANMYLNDRMSKKNPSRLGITEEEAIVFLREGVAKGMPFAIAAASRFLKDYMNTTAFLYNGKILPKKSSKEFKEIVELGKLALSICSDESIRQNINAVLTLGAYVKSVKEGGKPDEEVVKKSRVLIEETHQKIDEFAKKCKLSKKRSVQGTKEFLLEVRLTTVVDSFINKIEAQREKYQHKLDEIMRRERETSRIDPLQVEVAQKMIQLERATAQLMVLKSRKSDIPTQLKALNAIACKLYTTTKDLPPSNLLKRFINKILSKNYFKSYAHDIAKESRKMLFSFQQKMDSDSSQTSQKIEPDPTRTHLDPVKRRRK